MSRIFVMRQIVGVSFDDTIIIFVIDVKFLVYYMTIRRKRKKIRLECRRIGG
jgi:hypothetical protein